MKSLIFVFQKESVQSFLVHLGFINFVLAWPVANIVIKNDTFRILTGWGWQAYVLFLALFLFIPVCVSWGIERALRARHAIWNLWFRYSLFVCGGALFWTQVTEYYLNPFFKGTLFLGEGGRHVLLAAGFLALCALIVLMRNYLAAFFKVSSPAALLTAALLGFQTLQPGTPQSALNNQMVSIDTPVYLLIFDGVSLERLMQGDRINSSLFPTFARMSREWTWYRNATTNATSTIPARSMMFSGRYADKQRAGTLGDSDILLSRMGSFFFASSLNDASLSRISSGMSSRFSVSLLKNLVWSYLEVSLPSLLRPYIIDTLLSSWKFDWRGEPSKGYSGRKRDYYGPKIEQTFEYFTAQASNPEFAQGRFFLLWSMLSHFPYVFNADGTIHHSSFTSFEVGMSEEAKHAVEQNYMKTLQNVDRNLGNFLEELEKSGLYDRAVLLVTSDHGISDTGSNSFVTKQVSAIPFFLKVPGLQSDASDRDVQTVDITPTLLDAVEGLPVLSPYDGQSLLRPYVKRDKLMFALGTTKYWVLGNNGIWEYKK